MGNIGIAGYFFCLYQGDRGEFLGEEPYIDINVFNGTEQEFERYAK